MHYRSVTDLPMDPYLFGGFTALLVISGLLSAVLVLVLVFYFMRKARTPVNIRDFANGVRCRATIHSITETGLHINNAPQVDLGLMVHLPTGSKPAAMRTVIPLTQIPQYQPGAEIEVLVDGDNPSRAVMVSGPATHEAGEAPPPSAS